MNKMGMNKKQIFNILFWVLLIIGIALLIWKIFGESPADFAVMIPFILMLILKMWSISDELKEFKHDVKSSFGKIKIDIDNLKPKR